MYVRIAAMCCTHVSAPLSPGGGGGGARIRAGGINPCMGGGGAPAVDARVEVRTYTQREVKTAVTGACIVVTCLQQPAPTSGTCLK